MATPESQGGIDYQDGGFSSGGASYPLAGDLGELAARVGSPVTHNREGSILFIDGFEHGISAWTSATSGTGAEVKTSAQVYRSGGYSCMLTGGSDASRQAYIFRRFPFPRLGNYGLELTFFPGSHIWLFGVLLSYFDGTTEHQFYVLYDDTNNELQVTGPGGSSTAFATGIDLTLDYYPMHTMKLVADFENDTYLRFILNETEYDLTDYSAYTLASSDSTHLSARAIVYSVSGQNATCWVDDVIITRNEPTRE